MLWWALPAQAQGPIRFKPLQNGAVLCCRVRVDGGRLRFYVSNPFRTGRYCAGFREFWEQGGGLPMFQTPSERGGIVLTPPTFKLYFPLLVSNPFRTGRYCAAVWNPNDHNQFALFQTPSERGGIVLRPHPSRLIQTARCFKPLQNGAVLCWRDPDHHGEHEHEFQTPSERGGIVLT